MARLSPELRKTIDDRSKAVIANAQLRLQLCSARLLENDEEYSEAVATANKLFELDPEDAIPTRSRLEDLIILATAYKRTTWLIETDDDHEDAMKEFARVWNAKEGTPESDLLDLLANRIEAYANKRWPISD